MCILGAELHTLVNPSLESPLTELSLTTLAQWQLQLQPKAGS